MQRGRPATTQCHFARLHRKAATRAFYVGLACAPGRSARLHPRCVILKLLSLHRFFLDRKSQLFRKKSIVVYSFIGSTAVPLGEMPFMISERSGHCYAAGDMPPIERHIGMCQRAAKPRLDILGSMQTSSRFLRVKGFQWKPSTGGTHWQVSLKCE